MSAISIVLTVLLLIVSLILIGSILLQSGKSAGMSGTIAGGAESIWGKSKGRTYEGFLEKMTAISAGAFIVLALVLNLVR